MAHSYRQTDVPLMPAESESTVLGCVETKSDSPAVTSPLAGDALQLSRSRAVSPARDDAVLRGPDLDRNRTVLADGKLASGSPEKVQPVSSGDIPKFQNGTHGKASGKRGAEQPPGDTRASSGASRNWRSRAAGALARFGHSGGFR